MYHLMSVLGTSDYRESIYSWKEDSGAMSPESADDSTCTSRYVQIASLQKIIQEHPEEAVKVSIFLTQKARKANWEDSTVVRKSEKKGIFCTKVVKETKSLTGLERELQIFKEKNAGCAIEVEAIDIPEGRTKAEQDVIFDAMFQQMGQEEVICFDLTHGFRSIPILALTVVDYARAVKKIRVGGLYYGAYEAKDEKTGCVPIFDMTYCDSILQWTGAAESFIASGSSNQLLKVYRETAGTDEPEEIRRMVEGLNDLTNCLETSRGKNLKKSKKEKEVEKKSIQRAYMVFKEQFDKINRNQSSSDQAALQNLFAMIEEDTKIFDLQIKSRKGNRLLKKTAIGISAIRWAIDKNLTQQGLTALEATITTYIGELCEFPMNDYHDRELISTVLMNRPVKDPKDVNKAADMKKTIGSRIRRSDDLAGICKTIKILRNSINHFGMDDFNTRSYESLKEELVKGFRKFVEIVSKDCTLSSTEI